MFSFFTRKADEQKQELSDIEKKIQRFKKSYRALEQTNAQIGGIGGASTGLWLWGSLSGWGLIAVYVGLCVYNNQLLHRDEKTKEFQSSLKELLELYQQRMNQGPQASHDLLTLTLLEEIAPFIVDTKELVPVNFYKNSEGYNKKFCEILANAPHNLLFLSTDTQLEKKPDTSTSYLSKGVALFNRGYNSITGSSINPEVDQFIKNFSKEKLAYKRLKADLFQIVYGYESASGSAPKI